MVRFLIALFLIFPFTAGAVYAPGLVNTIQVCGQTLSLTNLIHIYTSVSATGYQSTFRRATNANGTVTNVSYTPSGSNNFRVKAMRGIVTSSSGNNMISLGYADTDTGWRTGAGTPLVNPKWLGGGTSVTGGLISTQTVSTASAGVDQNLGCMTTDFLMPNGKYLVTQGDTVAVYWAEAYGYEEP